MKYVDGQLVIDSLKGLPDDEYKVVIAELEKFLEEGGCEENPCRCGDILVYSSDFDSGSSNNNVEDSCFSTYSDGFVQYLDCNNDPIEPWSLHEANADVYVNPSFVTVQIDEHKELKLSLINQNETPITEFDISTAQIDNQSVANITNIGPDSITVKGIDVGITGGELTLGALGCQYKGFFSVEIEPMMVIAYSPVYVEEGDISSIGVKLSDSPAEGVNVIVTATETGDEDILIMSGDTLTFNSGNWNIEQFIDIDVAEDDEDSINGEAVILLEPNVSSYESKKVTVREIDNDVINFVPEFAALSVPEGGRGYFPVKLNLEPEAPVVAALSLMGDEDIEVGLSTFTFDNSNWDIFNKFTFYAVPDGDCSSGTATVTLSDTSDNVHPLLFGISEIEINNDCDTPPENDEPDPEVIHNHLYVWESKMNYNGTWARWNGVIPFSSTPTTDNTLGDISGSGSLNFFNAYTFQSYVHPGTILYDTNPGAIVDCYYQAKGTLSANLSGSRKEYVGVEPRYLITVEVEGSYLPDYYTCSDGYSASGDVFWDVYRQFTLENNNNYLDLFFGEQVQYQGELLDKENL